MASGYKLLRVEDQAARAPAPVVPIAQSHADLDVVRLTKDRDEWRTQAIQAGERLQHAETQLRDLRSAADESRARMNKAKTRQESAQAKVNDLQVEVIALRAERDELRQQLRSVESAKRKVWDAFEELQG